MTSNFVGRTDFYPRPPRGGRRRPLRLHPPHTHISIHALREEGDICHQVGSLIYVISIHALREEGDVVHQNLGRRFSISIHALREEGDVPQ